ncbi:MAG TPA: hypothetical protein VLA61_19260 [Ideonella sp.]|uniref:hypothetical protein n=1 Tax=Ideonella sp. TaxID=1929293 RepID=UPI002B65F644|nr:hypothetical protein [Ideonella sp.]HSI50417.1 hypothetical protein [Ideonella sp.]
MPATTDIEEVHQAIGEFVVFFQSIEDMYRQIGWFLIDPEKNTWPPVALRKESNADLIDKVTDLFLAKTKQHAFPNGAERAQEAEQLRSIFHALRKFRNKVVHSAYHEVVAGGQVAAILRTNPKILIDPDTGEVEYDQETFEVDAIRNAIGQHVQSFFLLHSIRMQLIHWYPYEQFPSSEADAPPTAASI